MRSLVNRVSAAGAAVVVAVGLALVAIVEQKVMPARSSPRPVAAPGPDRTTPRTAFPSRSKPRRKPVSPATLLSRKVQQVALAQRGPVARREFGAGMITPPVVGLSRMDHARTWAFGTEAIPPPGGVAAMPESSLFLARSAGTGWKVALAGTPEFTALLGKAPASVVPAAERDVLNRYSASVKPAGDLGLMLPWSVGQSWMLLPAEDGVSFDGGDGRVLAAADGWVYRLCSSSPDRGLVLLIRADGLATEYYQLNELTQVPDGGSIKQGDYLGRTSADQPCGGGQAPSRLVRFGVRNAAGVLPLDQVQMSGWTLHQTPAAMYADRDGLRVDAGNPLLNFGASPAPSPTPTKAGPANPKPSKSGKRGKPAKPAEPSVSPNVPLAFAPPGRFDGRA